MPQKCKPREQKETCCIRECHEVGINTFKAVLSELDGSKLIQRAHARRKDSAHAVTRETQFSHLRFVRGSHVGDIGDVRIK